MSHAVALGEAPPSGGNERILCWIKSHSEQIKLPVVFTFCICLLYAQFRHTHNSRVKEDAELLINMSSYICEML